MWFLLLSLDFGLIVNVKMPIFWHEWKYIVFEYSCWESYHCYLVLCVPCDNKESKMSNVSFFMIMGRYKDILYHMFRVAQRIRFKCYYSLRVFRTISNFLGCFVIFKKKIIFNASRESLFNDVNVQLNAYTYTSM